MAQAARQRPLPICQSALHRSSHWGEGVTADQMKELRWMKPRLVAQVRFVEWTADGNLRHSAFVGLRDDVDPQTVRKESDPSA
jgi:bifunctional non-homologous end joining protein LigD